MSKNYFEIKLGKNGNVFTESNDLVQLLRNIAESVIKDSDSYFKKSSHFINKIINTEGLTIINIQDYTEVKGETCCVIHGYYENKKIESIE